MLLLMFFWVYFTSFYVFIVGLIGVLNPATVCIISFLVGILLLLKFKARLRFMLDELKIMLNCLWESVLNRKLVAVGLGVMIFLLISRANIHIFFWPPYIWDALSYHLPKVADWIQYQKLIMIDTAISRSFWPANFELLQTWFSLFFHHDFMIEAAGLPFYFLAITSVYAVCRSFRMRRSMSLFLSLTFGYTPAVILHAVCGKNDIAVAGLYLFIVAIILDYRRYGDFFISRLIVVLMALSLAFGTKPYIVFIAPGILIIGLWSLIGRRSDDSKIINKKPSWAIVLSIVVLTGVSLGGYWCFRNYLMFENPFYPAEFNIFGRLIFEGQNCAQQGSFQLPSLVKNISELAKNRIFDSGGPYNPDLLDMAGWGWFAFAIGLPCLFAGIALLRDYRWLAIGFIISLVLLFGWVKPDPWYMRFTLWFPAVFVVGYGLMINKIRYKFIKIIFVILAIICSGINFIGTLSNGYAHVQDWENMANVSLFNRNSAMAGSSSYVKLHKILPDHETVGYFCNGNGRIYCLYDSDLSHKVHYLNMGQIKDIAEEMKKNKLQYIYIKADPEHMIKIESSILKNRMVKIGDNIYKRLK